MSKRRERKKFRGVLTKREVIAVQLEEPCHLRVSEGLVRVVDQHAALEAVEEEKNVPDRDPRIRPSRGHPVQVESPLIGIHLGVSRPIRQR